jgi:hypothetical protein
MSQDKICFAIIDPRYTDPRAYEGMQPRELPSGQYLIQITPINQEWLQGFRRYKPEELETINLESTFPHPMYRDEFYKREPFATKQLSDGRKLFRRKHGYIHNMPAGQTTEVVISVPYPECKINKLEVIDANARDTVDLIVLDTPDGTLSGFPNAPLNQFGFNVVVSDLLYSDKSDYDADLVFGMQLMVRYTNRTNADKEVGLNVIFHQVVRS